MLVSRPPSHHLFGHGNNRRRCHAIARGRPVVGVNGNEAARDDMRQVTVTGKPSGGDALGVGSRPSCRVLRPFTSPVR